MSHFGFLFLNSSEILRKSAFSLPKQCSISCSAHSQVETLWQEMWRPVSVLVFSRFFGFLPHSTNMQNEVDLIGDSKLPLSVNVSVDGCCSLHVTVRWTGDSSRVTPPFAPTCWDRLSPPQGIWMNTIGSLFKGNQNQTWILHQQMITVFLLQMKNNPIQDRSPVHGDDFVILPEPRMAISICSKDTMNITVSQCSLNVFQNLAKVKT